MTASECAAYEQVLVEKKVMQKYAIINTCGHEECGQRERDPYGGYYLASDVDARIAELEQQLRDAIHDRDTTHEQLVHQQNTSLMVSETK